MINSEYNKSVYSFLNTRNNSPQLRPPLKSAVVTNRKRVKRLCSAFIFWGGGGWAFSPFHLFRILNIRNILALFIHGVFFLLNHQIKFICPSIVDDADGYIWKRAAMGRGKCREVAWIRANKKEERDSSKLSLHHGEEILSGPSDIADRAQQDPLEENGMAGRFSRHRVNFDLHFYISVKNKQKNGGAHL